jgi:metal-responsive CopG/Arc/MetJ family transcriptional regulator
MQKKSSKRQMPLTRYSENFLVRLDVGMLMRVDEVLERFEKRSHMVREAIEREIKRRQRQKRRRDTRGPGVVSSPRLDHG